MGLSWCRTSVQLITVLVVALALVAGASAKRVGQPPPLIGDEHGANTRKIKRPAECHFGGKTYELEDTWHPDLGPPFGVMFCVRCECMLIQKKRRVVGRVRCRNIKNECPKPTCDEPVLLPGQCCKMCTHNFESNRIMSYDPTEDDDRNSNEFAAILTGLGMNPPVATTLGGHARFTFAKKNLHYSIYLGRHEQLTHVRFVDATGSILEEQVIDPEVIRSKSYKVCGVWRKIPRIYRKALRDENIYVELAQGKEAEALVRGSVNRYRSLSTETFSALLRPPPGLPLLEGSGGSAIISSMSTTASIIHFMLIFNGIVADNDPAGTLMVLRAESDVRTPSIILEETMKLSRPNNSLSVLEWKVELSPKELRQVLMGNTLLTLSPKSKPNLKLSGYIMPKLTCNSFQAVLSSANSLDEEKPITPAAGYALITLNDDNSVSYMINLHGLSSRLLALTLEFSQKKKSQVLENFIGNYNDSWANGTLTRTNPREIEMLLAGDLSINVATEKFESETRGFINQRLYNEAHVASSPILLTGTVMGTKTGSATGLAWLHVDSSCKLNYDLVLSGVETGRGKEKQTHHHNHHFMVELVESAQNNDGERRLLQEMSGSEAEDSVDDISGGTMSRVDSKVTYIQVNKSLHPGSNEEPLLVRGRINNVHVPLACLPQYEQFGDYPNHITEAETYKCFYEGKFFEDGSQWTSEHDSCMMCSCRRDRVSCDPVICPKPQCNNVVLLSGECCASCPDSDSFALDNNNNNKENNSRGCFFDGDKKWHQAGTIWHPYIPPFGFSLCAVCTCDSRTLKVDCQRITCPPLPCDEKLAIRADPQACCKVCPVSAPSSETSLTKTTDTMRDQGSARNASDILAEGGCEFQDQVFPNGHEWHPRLQPFGEEKCIRCNCKDRKLKCRRQKCPILHCDNRIEVQNQCCQRCADGSIKYRHKGSSKHKGKGGGIGGKPDQ